MKLISAAFWLGVIMYNVPSPGSQPPPPASGPHDGQRMPASAANSREPVKSSRENLTPEDRRCHGADRGRARSCDRVREFAHVRQNGPIYSKSSLVRP